MAANESAWDTREDQIFRTNDGHFASALELYSMGLSSRLGREPIGMRYFRRSHHGHVIHTDKRGFAYCKTCNLIFNAGPNGDDGPDYEEKAYGYIPEETKAPPPRWRGRSRKAAR